MQELWDGYMDTWKCRDNMFKSERMSEGMWERENMNVKLREAIKKNETLCSAEFPKEYNLPDLEKLLERDRLLAWS